MKRGLKFAVLVLGIFILFMSMIAGISAACSSSDQIIMKLYSSSNSHGALWNQSYPYEICYNDIFGVPGSGIHTCSGTNNVLWLYQINNSHASDINANGYNIPVCYGDLTCRNVTTACAADERIVARLYQDNNSHISSASDTNYPIKICCKTGGAIPPPTGNVYWANMQGTPITESSIGSTVWMIYENKAGPDRYDFNIIENDLINNDDIRTISENFINGLNLGAAWTITQADFDKGLDAGELIDGEEEFKFIVNGTTSEQLIVNENNYSNPPPTTNITNPKYKDVYVINQSTLRTTNILFTQISSDINDDLKLTWEFGDGTSEIFENILKNNIGDTSHNYSTPGTKSIKLTAEEMSPPRAISEVQSASDATEIYVYGEGVIVFAIITKPNPNEMQELTSRFVEINASATHVTNCSYDKTRCEASGGGAGSCYDVNDTITKEGIWCYKFPPVQQNSTKMEWTFDGDAGNKLIGTYGANYSKVVEFIKVFEEPGKHTLNLRAIYTTP
jgi:hypothetical protein